jgi:hypothetical protein
MSDESSGERDIGVTKAAEKEILEEKYLNRTAFQTITFSEVWMSILSFFVRQISNVFRCVNH